MLRKHPALWAVLAASTAGCSILGSYPYPDESHPAVAPSVREKQSPVTQLSSPLEAVCHLTTRRRNIKKLWIGDVYSTGSAALAQGRYLITAAHNVYDYPLGWLDHVDVSCNQKTATAETVIASLNREHIKQRVSAPGYAWRLHGAERKFEFDFAFIDLGTSVMDDDPFLVDERVVPRVGEALFLGGYPGGDISHPANKLHLGSGVVVGIDNNLMTYDIETATGNSGGPVWVTREGKHYLVGVHVSDGRARLFNASFFTAWNRFLKSAEKSSGTH
nr:serine protease [Myxococcus fulvus]